RDLFRALAAVRVHEHGGARIRRERADAGVTSGSVAAPRLAHHPGPSLPGDDSRLVRGPVIDDDDLRDGLAGHAANEVADHRGLVQRGDDQHRLHTAPRPALAPRSRTLTAWSPSAIATPTGVASTMRAHGGMAHGSVKKKLYA